MYLRDYLTIKERREALEREMNVSLKNIGLCSTDEGIASVKNCENMIGGIHVPVGVAGPLLIRSKLQDREIYVPLATTEGALVASVARGSKAITQSNGATIRSKRVGISRAPVFAIQNLKEAEETTTWLDSQILHIKKVAEKTSSHVTFLSLKHWLVGKNLFVRFVFDTQDAMGMNMITIAVTEIAKEIEKNTPAKLIAVSGNMCVDKKANTLNVIEGRGIQVWAEVVLSKNILTETLKTTPEKFIEVIQRKVYLGSILSGSIGANSHAANVLAALFLATGQDIAHVAEAASVVTSAELLENGIYVSVFLPDLPIGTVGGGTNLSTQKEA
ncbi:MAG TPA: hydroxymethylglutaryl-CoA reductase, partial [Patescibacteria group bacterium]